MQYVVRERGCHFSATLPKADVDVAAVAQTRARNAVLCTSKGRADVTGPATSAFAAYAFPTALVTTSITSTAMHDLVSPFEQTEWLSSNSH